MADNNFQLQATSDGVILPVRAQPGARRNAITGVHAGALKVAVTQAAEKGKANEAIIDVLCESLGMRSSDIQLKSGASSRQKQFVIRGVAVADLLNRIAAALSDGS